MRFPLKSRHLALGLALTNAALYSCFLPLWEGFDEPFHYGYVEALSVWHEVPTLNRTPISAEIRQSLTLTPLSRLLSGAVPNSISFEDWVHLPLAEKLNRANELHSLSPTLRHEKSDILNYEAQQAPLAYAIEAPLDTLLPRCSLPSRILFLRLFGALASTALLYLACCKLLEIVGVRGAYELAVLACIFSSQMLWASVAHVGNDWLATALTLCFLAAIAEFVNQPAASKLILLAGVLSAGLLTKAYFLVFIPLFLAAALLVRKSRSFGIALVLPLLIAGPWYLRNFWIYGSVSGTQQGAAGIGLVRAMAAIPRINWFKSLADFTRWSLWTGNWSFLSFSRVTLDAEALLLAVALASYFIRYRQIGRAQQFVLAGCGCFVVGLFYQACVTWVHTGGVAQHPEPWYWQGIIPCFWIFGFRGLQASGIAGRICATLLCLITAWIAALTYVAKLIPFYAGGISRATLHNVLYWWSGNPVPELKAIMLGPLPLTYALLFALLCLLLTISVWNVNNLLELSK